MTRRTIILLFLLIAGKSFSQGFSKIGYTPDTVVYQRAVYDSLVNDESNNMAYIPNYINTFKITYLDINKTNRDTTTIIATHSVIEYFVPQLDAKGKIQFHVYKLSGSISTFKIAFSDTVYKNIIPVTEILVLNSKYKLYGRFDIFGCHLFEESSYLDGLLFQSDFSDMKYEYKLIYGNQVIETTDAGNSVRIKLHKYRKPGKCNIANYLCDM
jgi:hypothetical protein